MKCTDCSFDIPKHLKSCAECGKWYGHQNIRAAQEETETSALSERYASAFTSSEARGCKDKLLEFEKHLNRSKAVMCRSLSDLQYLLAGPENTYSSHLRGVSAKIKTPQDEGYDQSRDSFERILFPNYADEIIYAALSLDGKGPEAYGDAHLELKDSLISKRTSVFDENVLNFAKKHKMQAGDNPPAGYRASWNDRGKLAVAKLHSKIDENTPIEDFSHILLLDDGTTDGVELIEAHINGTISSKTIEKVHLKQPVARDDRLMWKIVEEKLSNNGISVELV